MTGLGGISYVVTDAEASRVWYRETLGIDGLYGTQLNWADEPLGHPYSLISHFSDDAYIKAGQRWVHDQPARPRLRGAGRGPECAGLVAALCAQGVELLGETDEGYGKFTWLLDPDGVKIGL